jgi:TolB-like protein
MRVISVMRARLLVAVAFFCISCSLGPGNLRVTQKEDLATRKIRRVAVLPLGSVTRAPQGPAGKAERKDPGLLLDSFIYNALQAAPHWQVVSDREVGELRSSIPSSAAPTRQAVRLGELVYADAVLSGRILRFRERIGESFGVQSPASVAFTLQLVDVKRGDVIWTAQFDETQKALSENLFALADVGQRGVKWLKAEELAEEGVKKAIEQLNRLLYPS